MVIMSKEMINLDYLELKKSSDQFISNYPIPHIVLDNFLNISFFKEINSEIQIINDLINQNQNNFYNTDTEKNKWISKNIELPENMKKLLQFLNSEEWILNLENLTRILGLLGTVNLNKKISNYHVMKENGFLGSHIDHSSDPDTGFPHVLNIILYLSNDWKEEYGGSTVFYNHNGKEIKKEIKYKANRAVIFLHSPYSFHGVTPILGNKGTSRSTIYIDYFSKRLNPFENLKLDITRKWFDHDTTFILPRTLDYFKKENKYYLKSLIKYKLKKFKSYF